MSNNPVTGGPLTGPEIHIIHCRNAEASADIALGGVAIFNMNGTRDGKDVVLPSSSSAAKQSFVAGVALKAVEAGKVGKFIAYGVIPTLTIQLRSRAATTDAWPTAAAIAVGDALRAETVNNYATLFTAGAATGFLPYLQALGSTASSASSASTTSNSDLVSTVTMKAFIRAL